MLIKNASVVWIQACMAIQGLWNIIYITIKVLKNNKSPNIDPWRTSEFMVPASENTLSTETKRSFVCEIRIQPFHFLLKFYGLRYQRPFEDRLKSSQYIPRQINMYNDTVESFALKHHFHNATLNHLFWRVH